MLLFYSEATLSALESKALVAALLSLGSFKDMETSVAKTCSNQTFLK